MPLIGANPEGAADCLSVFLGVGWYVGWVGIVPCRGLGLYRSSFFVAMTIDFSFDGLACSNFSLSGFFSSVV